MEYYRRFIFIFWKLFLSASSAAQWLPVHVYGGQAMTEIIVQPVLHPVSKELSYLFGWNYQKEGPASAFGFRLHSIEQTRLTGIGYPSKSNHLYSSGSFKLNILNQVLPYFDRKELSINQEQFWRLPTVEPDLMIHRSELQLYRNSHSFLFGFEMLNDELGLSIDKTSNMEMMTPSRNYYFGAITDLWHSIQLQNKVIVGGGEGLSRFT